MDAFDLEEKKQPFGLKIDNLFQLL